MKIDRVQLDRERCKRSLITFVKKAWHVLEPGQPYVHGWHMEAVCEHLEAVTRGNFNRLLINIPPGTSKSMLVGVFWPAWEWGPNGAPNKRFIGASHEQALATRDTVKMRRLITSDWYQERWPVPLMSDQNEKTYYENDSTGFRQACAVKSMTGRRGDCLTGSSVISTDVGDMAIRDIVECEKSCNVLSVELNTGRLVYRSVQAVARRKAHEIYRVHSSCGRVVECTGDHRIYTARGYVQARLLSPGDVLLREVRSSGEAQRLRAEESGETWKKGNFLQPFMFNNLDKYQARKHWAILQCLRTENIQRASSVLRRLSSSGQATMGRDSQFENTGSRLRALWKDISSKNAHARPALLQSCVLEQGALSPHSWRQQSNVAGRSGFKTLRSAECAAVQKDSQCSAFARRERVRLLRPVRRSVRASHGHGYCEQFDAEFSSALPRLPCAVARPSKVATRRTTVTLVERISRPEMVYDIQVEGTRCFFANGILVHNCVIWDDPHSVEGAKSAAERNTALEVFRETLPTRLNNPIESAIIIVMQRLHESDVSGLILENDFGYEHLMLPMEFEPERRCVTSLGIADKRTYDGELLFPERFPLGVVERDKKLLGTYGHAGQNQQRPAPRTGGFFAWEKLEVVDAAPPLIEVIRYWDKAGTEGGGAYTAGVKMGRSKDGIWYVLDVVRGQWGATTREKTIKQTAELDGDRCAIWIEQEPGSGGKESAEGTVRNLAGYNIKSERATGDKAIRAEPYAVQVEAENIKLVKGPWNKLFIDEHKTFPNGKYKDQIDATGGCFNKIAKPSKFWIG